MFSGFLIRPSNILLNVTKILEGIFVINFDNEKFIVQRLADKILTIIPNNTIPMKVLLCLIHTRLYIHI